MDNPSESFSFSPFNVPCSFACTLFPAEAADLALLDLRELTFVLLGPFLPADADPFVCGICFLLDEDLLDGLLETD